MPRSARGIRPSPIAAAIWFGLLSPSAFAQTPAPATTATPEAQEVVISGSRIKRDTYTSTAPLQIIRNEDSTLAGFSSTAEVMQGTAVTGGSSQINNAYGGFVTDGGPGANTIGLRGFIPTRTLVMLNGRRLAPSGTRGAIGAADLNILPNAIVDRIEVLKDGASSIYGSDAVAGVVNIITKRNLEGIKAETQITRTEDGGGDQYRLSLSGGFVSDRMHMLASYDYSKRTSLTLGDRDWTQCNTDYRRTSVNGVVGDWGSRDFIDPATGKPKCYPISGTGSNGVTINTIGTNNLAGVGAAGSVGTTFNRWRPNASINSGLVGFEGVGGGANSLNVRDTFDPRMLNRSLISPNVNHNLYVQGGMDLAQLGDAELYYEVLYNRRESSQTGFRQLALDYRLGSPLIPSSLAASNFAAPFAAPNNMTGPDRVGVRAFVGVGNDQSSQSVDFVRAVAGLRGALLKSGWDYDVTVSHSESKGKYTFENFLVDRLTQSSAVVASGNGFACVDPSNGCVAAPALTAAVIGGKLPADWMNYVFRPVTGMSKYKEDMVTATLTGKLLQLPYGAMKAAVGAEFRTYSLDDTPPLDSQSTNLYGFSSAFPTRGNDNVKEVFAELEVPLLASVPFAEQLTANVSGRWSDYKSYGSGSTYKFGALWSPVKWLTLRGTTGTSYRAPALYEQYLGSTSGFISQQNDPCNDWSAASQAGTTRAINCASEGLPTDFNATQGIRVLTTGGATAGLKSETSKNNTFGLVFQPSLPTGMGDLSLALDIFSITVNNGVARAGATNILSLCYDDPQFRSGGGFCRLINPRDPAAFALTVNDSYVNLATDIVKGRDYTARYTNDIGIGKLRVNMTVTEFRSQANKLFADDPLDEVNGTIGSPKWSGTLDVNYEVKGWRFYYGLNYVGKMDSYAYLEEDAVTSTYKLSTPKYFTHTLAVGYKADKWDINVGVRNLLDEKPPMISAQAGYNRVGNAPLYSGYDYEGRRFYLNASRSF